MLNNLRQIYNNISNSTKNNSGNSQNAELLEEILSVNLYREMIFSQLILLLVSVLILVDIIQLQPLWEDNPAYKNLLYAHIIMVVPLLIFIHAADKNGSLNRYVGCNLKRVLHYGIILVILYWSVILSINAQLIHGQISAYIISAISIATITILSRKESIIIFLSSYILFIIGLLFVEKDSIKLFGGIINSSFLIPLVYAISRMTNHYYVNNYLYKKDIGQKTSEINEMNSNLEELANERANKLILANQQLMFEMETRHKAELEAATVKMVYEEKERAFDKAIELEKMKTAFYTNVSHEFKTPLNIILSAQQLLEYKLINMTDQEVYKQVSRQTYLIRQNSYRLVKLVSNLLDMNKIESGYFELNLKNHDIIQVVEDIVLSAAEFIESKGITLVFDTTVEEKIIACDDDKIERVILNLLSNAVKFTPKKGSISVNIWLTEASVIISVRDTGTGILEGKLSSIFHRYVQAENYLIQNSEGSGIGLFLVKSIVEMHQGTIVAKSEYGTGSEFLIELPDHMVELYATIEDSKYNFSDKKIDMINVEFSDIYSL